MTLVDEKLLTLVCLEAETKIPTFIGESLYSIARIVAETLGEKFDPLKSAAYLKLLDEARNERQKRLEEIQRVKTEAHEQQLTEITKQLLGTAKRILVWKSPSGNLFELDSDYPWNSREHRISTTYIGFSKESIESWEKAHCPREGKKLGLLEASNHLLRGLAEKVLSGELKHTEINVFKELSPTPPIQVLLNCGCTMRDQCAFHKFGCHTIALTLVGKK